jgi:hypothetical protein
MISTPPGSTDYLRADMNNPGQILVGAREVLDFGEPIAIIFMGVLGHVADTADARTIVRTLMNAIAPGSYLVIGDSVHTTEGAAVLEAQGNYSNIGAVPYSSRSEAELRSFSDGLRWVDPGFVPVPQWRPRSTR